VLGYFRLVMVVIVVVMVVVHIFGELLPPWDVPPRGLTLAFLIFPPGFCATIVVRLI